MVYGGWGQCGEVKYKSLCCVALVCSAEIPLRAVHLLPPSFVCVYLPFSEKAERVVCVCEREREADRLDQFQQAACALFDSRTATIVFQSDKIEKIFPGRSWA